MKNFLYKKGGRANASKSFSPARSFFFPFALIFTAALMFLPAADGDGIVYVTGSGRKYHRDGCSSLRNSKIAVSIQDAAASGYGPCSICRPPEFNPPPSPPLESRAGQELYRVNIAEPASYAAADTARMTKAEVIEHIDGDTIRVRIANPPDSLGVVETVRFLGVDTPETVHSSKPVERFGMEASAFTKERLLRKNVSLAFDWDLRDRYGRLLAYVYMEDGACFNAVLINEGYGFAYLRYSFRFRNEFRALEQNARKEKRGLWAN